MSYLGKVKPTVALTSDDITDGAVVEAKIGGNAVTSAKINDGAIVNADLNTSAAIALSKLATDPSNASNLSSGTVPTARLGSGTASSSTFLRGDQTYAAAGGDNTPSFRAQNGSNQTVAHNTWAKVAIDTENWDTDSAYDASTNYRFTVPTGEGGKYIFWYGAYFEGGVPQDKASELALNVNGTTDNMSIMRTSASDLVDARIHGMSFPISLSATDYVEFYVRSHGGSNTTLIANFAVFGGMKMIGV